ncbi:thiosulfate sulfurtransferase/rhodanese-like domain-containing protein 3 [Rhinatrema bivittatum]|uniref:thiosulfate sulfurtransferase/rhodanese-like domain-containing protein 3 n=1 Tax=Rhinatrema bivittatum TaxID=194408 RepID=UPI0011278542|nr:thiosulfate sulfurtransferase/rhodanese-like domain-containing protein 3 [Rhinatrema bivittatum]
MNPGNAKEDKEKAKQIKDLSLQSLQATGAKNECYLQQRLPQTSNHRDCSSVKHKLWRTAGWEALACGGGELFRGAEAAAEAGRRSGARGLGRKQGSSRLFLQLQCVYVRACGCSSAGAALLFWALHRGPSVPACGLRKPLFCGLCTAPVQTLSYQQLKDLLKSPDTVHVDVRELWEIKEYGIIPGAVNIPLGEVVDALQMNPMDFKKKYNQAMPSKSDCVVFSCLAGVRSLKAFDSAVALGYSRSQHYSGGLEDWMKHEPPVKKQ